MVLCLHYAARFEAWRLWCILQRNPSATRASAKLSYWPSSAPPLFHVISRTATLLTLFLFSVPPGSGSGLLDILDGAGNHVLSAAVRFPEINGVSAIVAEILRPGRHPPSLVGRNLPLHYACESASLEAVRSWSSCWRILLASPSVVAALPAARGCHTACRCGCGAALAGSGLGAAVNSRQPEGLEPDASFGVSSRLVGPIISRTCYDANKSWIKAQTNDGMVPLHGAGATCSYSILQPI
jgi:hypothetical protein